MKWYKRIAVLVAVLLLCSTTLFGCSRQKDNAITLRVWGAQEDQELLKEMIDSFKKANPDKNYDITLGVVGENDAQKRVLEDPKAAAEC